MMSDLIRCSYVFVKSPRCCRKHMNAFMFTRAHTATSTSIRLPIGNSLIPTSQLAVARHPLFLSPDKGVRVTTAVSPLLLVGGAQAGTRLWVAQLGDSGANQASLLPLGVSGGANCLLLIDSVCVCVCEHLCACVCACVLIIQSVLKLKDASPDASLIVGVFNGERQMRWEAKGGATAVKSTRRSVVVAYLLEKKQAF